ncbi:MAG: LysR family transcriptional regulator [Proteobacteria bacterium]|nr:LysR family transcriptional regulator [Pseudomonadota bacterium]
MNFNQLRIFYSVAKNKSVTLAAKELYLTQPAVSIQIHLLEDDYGVKLFNRSGKGITTTEEGNLLFSYAEKILNLSDETDEALRQIKSLERGKVKIGAGRTIGAYYLPQLFESFTLKYPSIGIQMDIGSSSQVIEGILSFRNDIGFIGTDYFNKNLVVIPFTKDRLVLITPPDHELTHKKVISYKDLSGQKMIMREKGSGTRELIENELVNRKVSTETIMELGSNEAIKHAVEAGLGVSIISNNVIKREKDLGRVKILHFSNNQDIIMNIYIVYHKDKYLSPLLKSFLNIAKEFYNQTHETI